METIPVVTALTILILFMSIAFLRLGQRNAADGGTGKKNLKIPGSSSNPGLSRNIMYLPDVSTKPSMCLVPPGTSSNQQEKTLGSKSCEWRREACRGFQAKATSIARLWEGKLHRIHQLLSGAKTSVESSRAPCEG